MDNITVIGAAGHVGLPFSLVCANAGYNVLGIDMNKNAVEKINSGIVPFIEEGAEPILKQNLQKQTIRFSDNYSDINHFSDAIAVMIGTPIDEEGNPRLDHISQLFSLRLLYTIQKTPGILILLRSTVSPGTTKILKDLIEKELKIKEGVDFHLVFAPERVAQGVGIKESTKFPQLIGAFSWISYRKAETFFEKLGVSCIQLSPDEAEFGKLITNMYRYVNFALANEFYMIGQKKGIDVSKVIKAANKDYPRMALPLPGPNVGGPCLFKDGKFLLNDVPYVDLIQSSFIINEGFPDYIFNLIKSKDKSVQKILILGSAFKGDNDDTRNSLSFKLRKVCEKNGVSSVLYDPHVDHPRNSIDVPKGIYDAVVVMTPHTIFKDWLQNNLHHVMDDTIIVDIWNRLSASDGMKNGIYKVYDYLYKGMRSEIMLATQGE